MTENPKVTLADGPPVTPEHCELRANGRKKGSARPLRYRYVHEKCSSVTTLGAPIADIYSIRPGFYRTAFCARCGAHFPVGERGEFVWEGTSEKVGT